MATCKADPSIERAVVEGFEFPLGVYPVEPMTPKPGYTVQFEPADGDDEEGEWEEWPDRYVFDIVLPAKRIPLFCHMALAMMPERVFPILDLLGQDGYREIDPYISYDLVGQDRILDAWRRFHDFFFEDGLVGFGAMTEEPFGYVFVDEHKIVTLRVEPQLKERTERLLKAFGLEAMEDPAGADAAAHEHRGVLVAPAETPQLLSYEEIVEALKLDWQLMLNIDPDRNVDDEGKDLGTTYWRCVVRVETEQGAVKYAEVYLAADSIRGAEETAMESAEQLEGARELEVRDAFVLEHDRLLPEQIREDFAKRAKEESRGDGSTPTGGGEEDAAEKSGTGGAGARSSGRGAGRGGGGGGISKIGGAGGGGPPTRGLPKGKPRAGEVYSARWME
jgi:hypothetical protein